MRRPKNTSSGTNASSGAFQASRQGRPQDNRGNYNQFQPRYNQGYGQGRQPFSYGQQSQFSGAGYAPAFQRQSYTPNAYSNQPQAYGQYGQHSELRQAPTLPAPRQPLQIAAPLNASGSTPRPPYTGNQNRFQRNDRKFPGNGNRWQQNGNFRQKALAYQTTVEDEEEPQPPGEEGTAYHTQEEEYAYGG